MSYFKLSDHDQPASHLMPLILNIESATEVCSVCIADGSKILSLAEEQEPFRHSEKLTLLVQECLLQSGLGLKDMEAIALSSGPGSYTSLRVGSSVAKGICFALDLPLIIVDTLESLAAEALRQFPEAQFFCPMIDARRMEVYTATFDRRLHQVSPTIALVLQPTSFASELEQGKVVFTGNGAEKCKSMIQNPNAVFLPQGCSAKYLIPLSVEKFLSGKFTTIAPYEPFYLKPPNITSSSKIL